MLLNSDLKKNRECPWTCNLQHKHELEIYIRSSRIKKDKSSC